MMLWKGCQIDAILGINLTTFTPDYTPPEEWRTLANANRAVGRLAARRKHIGVWGYSSYNNFANLANLAWDLTSERTASHFYLTQDTPKMREANRRAPPLIFPTALRWTWGSCPAKRRWRVRRRRHGQCNTWRGGISCGLPIYGKPCQRIAVHGRRISVHQHEELLDFHVLLP